MLRATKGIRKHLIFFIILVLVIEKVENELVS